MAKIKFSLLFYSKKYIQVFNIQPKLVSILRTMKLPFLRLVICLICVIVIL